MNSPASSVKFAVALPLLGWSLAAGGAEPAAKETREQRAQRMSLEAEKTGLAAPFVGITTHGQVQPGLFHLRATGVSTVPVREAALAYLAALTPAKRTQSMFPVGDPEWRKWMNQDFYVRQGLAFRDMEAAQREAAWNLLRASLSAKGLNLSRDIMRLNHTLGELSPEGFARFSETFYWISIMGEPSADQPWGWQIDGHHLIINYFVLGDQVVMTPSFFGSEPVTAPSGKYQGTTILQDEQNAGLKFMRSLDDAQRARATLASTKTANHNLTEAFKDNVVLDYAGLRASELTAPQKQQLADLIGVYVGNQDDGHARVKMAEVREHLDETFFAWIGDTTEDAVFYYRIHSPVILVEFDHQRPVNLRHLAADPAVPVKEHIHVVVRTPNGNDYGKDLLRQHLEAHAH